MIFPCVFCPRLRNHRFCYFKLLIYLNFVDLVSVSQVGCILLTKWHVMRISTDLTKMAISIDKGYDNQFI